LIWFRIGVALYALIVGVLALWILVTEIIRPAVPYFPTEARDAKAFAIGRSAALGAARFGLIRGELWTEAALTQAVPAVFDPDPRTSRSNLADIRNTLEHAAKSAPHDPRNWLMLAAFDSRLEARPQESAENLKLAYYTGANEFVLSPLRLAVAAQLDWAEELQTFVQLEIEQIIMRHPELKPAIAAAYQSAKPQAQKFIETTLQQADPELLASLTHPPR